MVYITLHLDAVFFGGSINCMLSRQENDNLLQLVRKFECGDAVGCVSDDAQQSAGCSSELLMCDRDRGFWLGLNRIHWFRLPARLATIISCEQSPPFIFLRQPS